jgi:hypothetical protein
MTGNLKNRRHTVSDQKQVVLSQENIDSMAKLASIVGGEKEVRADPNLVLSLLLRHMYERFSSGMVSSAVQWSMDPDMIAGARARAAREKKAA